jgi:hypothetical protein
MGHGVPREVEGECGCGETGAFMLDAGISSTFHSARTWGLLDPAVRKSRPADRSVRSTPPTHGRIGQVIDDALRAAGLMR